LASIVSNEPSGPTQALTTTEVPGGIPSAIPNAPPLPGISNLNPANYPALDKVPPTDSPEVQQWIQDVINTGIVIPNLTVTNPGGCGNNTAIWNDTERCWWTCTGCVAPFDVTACPTPSTWGLTYDDGPAFYTPNLLSYLDANNLKSTFFTVGSRCLEFPYTLQDEYMSGHQIAVHTWSHPYLTTLTNEEIIAELGWTKKIIKDVLGVTPNMMRPPYGDIDNRVRAISVAMGLLPSMWTRLSPLATFDTGDFYIESGGTTAPEVLQNWEYIMGNISTLKTGFIVLEHDLFEQTVQLATGYILPDALATVPKLTITPVISCLNLPMSDAYIETNNNVTNAPVLSGTLVTIVPPSATGGPGSKSSSDDLRVGLSLMFIMTVATLLAGVYAVRF